MSMGAKRVSIMATGASPEADGGEYVLKELSVSEIKSKDFTLIPNKTNYWLKNNKTWLQPEDEDEALCQHCDEGHSHITPCSDGGQHSLLSQQMASALAASSRDPNDPLKWAPYASQMQATPDVQASSVLATGTRAGSTPMYAMDRRARKAACSSITAKACVKAKDENMYSCLYGYDSD